MGAPHDTILVFILSCVQLYIRNSVIERVEPFNYILRTTKKLCLEYIVVLLLLMNKTAQLWDLVNRYPYFMIKVLYTKKFDANKLYIILLLLKVSANADFKNTTKNGLV